MQSKTSYFSKTIFLKNITRFWPIWAAYLVVCLLRLPLTLFFVLDTASGHGVTDIAVYRTGQLTAVANSALTPFFYFLFACITAVAVFSYLYQTRSSYMLHALPLCRESLFLTNVCSGLSFLVAPQLLAFLASIFVCFIRQMTHLDYLLHWLLLSTIMVIFAFSMAVFMVMITGSLIAAPILFLIGNYLFVALRGLVSLFVETLSYGVDSANIAFGTFLSPYFFLSRHFSSFFSWLFGVGQPQAPLSEIYPYMGFYAAASPVLLLLAFLIYKKKHLETAGDVIAIGFLKPLFRWGAAFIAASCVTLAGYSLTLSALFTPVRLWLLLLLMVLGGAVFFFLAQMLLEKRFLVFSRKRLLECGGFLLLCAAFLVSMRLDLFGVERRIPNKEEIASITVSNGYPLSAIPEDFDRIQEIHRQLIKNKKESEAYFSKYSQTAHYTTLGIKYHLKNGSTLSRSYPVPIEDFYLSQEDYVYHQLEALCRTPEYYLKYHFTDAYSSITFVDGYMDLYDEKGWYGNVNFDQNQCQQLFEALKRDIQTGNYRIYNYALYEQTKDKVYENYLSFNFQVPAGTPYVTFEGMKTVAAGSEMQFANIQLTPDCVYTLDALRKMGFIEGDEGLITRQALEKAMEWQ